MNDVRASGMRGNVAAAAELRIISIIAPRVRAAQYVVRIWSAPATAAKSFIVRLFFSCPRCAKERRSGVCVASERGRFYCVFFNLDASTQPLDSRNEPHTLVDWN